MPTPVLSDGAYLHECARLHADLTSLLSKRPQNFTAVEKAVARVRSKGALRYENIRAIVESPHFSAGRQFWSWPDREEIEAGLHDQKLDLWHLYVVRPIRTSEPIGEETLSADRPRCAACVDSPASVVPMSSV